ncbi:PREDICTED: uncharacterized protein LOC105953541 [Erythranthe guttata]|uniref:uncharacterized protein LOC105953541 n=1 Tax=Erythranthe guttata TaxID=4155 RepID=UPI00064DF99A|nr:PREDICTED: uncharacterized protein LOC105953541 [Erythranthe guttata]|eukprot:XP_012832669.1 PREDICTED: uncharacterized protein LOC105953541 [Erythranthe guttata]
MAKEENKVEFITAVYKTYLHCPKCAHDIQKPLLRIPGIHRVDAKFEKGEITVKGAIDAKKIHARLQKWSNKKVELISETKSNEEVKKEKIRTITIKAYLHCDQCEKEACRRLLLHRGIHNVKTDIKLQTITVEGVIESEKLVAYMRERVHKYGEKVVEFKEVVKEVEVRAEVPYFIHYVYAPQMSSDENPNACSIS